ncbi:MAG: PAS domain S-box protein, partial [Kiritimatiellales bacterium]
MRENNEFLVQYLEMRRAAERKAAMHPEILHAMSPEEFIHTIHELQVHQIELEMQNENLRAMQSQLADARARYFDLYDLAPVGYLSVSEKGIILESNLTADTLLGVPRNRLDKRPFSKVIHKEDQDIYYLNRKKLFETGAPQQCELRLLKDGEKPFWARLEATLGTERTGGDPVCRLVLSDISNRKRLEQDLADYATHLQAIVETEPECVKLVSPEGILLEMNPAGLKMIEAESLDQAQSRPLIDFVAPEYQAAFRGLLRRVTQGESGTLEFVSVGLKGGRRWLESHAVPLRDPHTGCTNLLSVTRDITEHKQAEEKLKTSQERIRQLAQHLETVREEEHTRFADALHDELGQILTAIKIDLATVAAECPAEVRLKEKIDGAQKLLSDGIMDIHALCRELRPGALDDLGLKEALDGLTEDWKRRNRMECVLCVDIDDEVLTDKIRTAVFRIVQAALTNVSDHAQASQVEVNLVADEQIIHFSVADNGRGMEPGAADKPESFGLLGMRERLEALDGKLCIESSPGKGTRIEGAIPL